MFINLRQLMTAAVLSAVAGAAAHAVPLLDATDPVVGGQLSGPIGSELFTVASAGGDAGVNNYPPSENPPFGIDQNAGTKYLNFAETNTGLLITPTEGLTLLTSFTLTTANDGPDRDPASYIVYGSNTVQTTGLELPGTTFNLSNFTQIGTGSILGTDPGRFASSGPVAVGSVTPYSSYLLIFPTVRNSANANSMQIGDVQFEGSVIPAGVPEGGATIVLLGLSTIGLGFFRTRFAKL